MNLLLRVLGGVSIGLIANGPIELVVGITGLVCTVIGTIKTTEERIKQDKEVDKS